MTSASVRPGGSHGVVIVGKAGFYGMGGGTEGVELVAREVVELVAQPVVAGVGVGEDSVDT